LVTGVAGFIGMYSAKAIFEQGHDIVNLFLNSQIIFGIGYK
jgi:nucleoside-diphosphate-sugar epimerase